MSEANATLRAWKTHPLDVSVSGDAHHRYIPSGVADLTILTDEGNRVELRDVPSREWDGLTLGARVRVDVDLRPEGSH